MHDGRLLGALAVALPRGGALSPAEDRLLNDLAGAAGLVLENERLIAELRASRQRLVVAQDDERRRLERDLHDGAQQQLLALAIDIQRLRGHLPQLGPCELDQSLAHATARLQDTIDDLRELARGIHPAVLTAGGLPPALQSLADRAAVTTAVSADLPRRPPPAVEVAAYFVACEALTNAVRPGHATHVDITATLDGDQLAIQIADAGTGGAVVRRGGGLAGLADRVGALGGTLAVRDASPGTVVRAELPCAPS
jgi:signal transduction histidine kinase